MTSLYHEEVHMPIILIVGVVLALLVVMHLYLPAPPEVFYILLPALEILFLLIILVFRKLTIEIDREYLTFGFSVVKSKVKISNIAEYGPLDVKFRNWFGAGVRYNFRHKVLGYITGFGKGVLIKQKEGKSYAFSTTNPERVCSVIKEALAML